MIDNKYRISDDELDFVSGGFSLSETARDALRGKIVCMAGADQQLLSDLLCADMEEDLLSVQALLRKMTDAELKNIIRTELVNSGYPADALN